MELRGRVIYVRVAKKPLRSWAGRMSTDSETFVNVRLRLRGPRWTEVTAMRLIDADAILKADENSDKALVLGSGKALEIAYALLKKKVEDAPTVDAVVVTRCKDCKHLCVWNRKDIYAFCPKTNIVFLPFEMDTRTFFCGFGERKDGGNADENRDPEN
jgi:hypothetical protein